MLGIPKKPSGFIYKKEVEEYRSKFRQAIMRLIFSWVLIGNFIYTSLLYYNIHERPVGVTTGDLMITEAILLVGITIVLTRE